MSGRYCGFSAARTLIVTEAKGGKAPLHTVGRNQSLSVCGCLSFRAGNPNVKSSDHRRATKKVRP